MVQAVRDPATEKANKNLEEAKKHFSIYEAAGIAAVSSVTGAALVKGAISTTKQALITAAPIARQSALEGAAFTARRAMMGEQFVANVIKICGEAGFTPEKTKKLSDIGRWLYGEATLGREGQTYQWLLQTARGAKDTFTAPSLKAIEATKDCWQMTRTMAASATGAASAYLRIAGEFGKAVSPEVSVDLTAAAAGVARVTAAGAVAGAVFYTTYKVAEWNVNKSDAVTTKLLKEGTEAQRKAKLAQESKVKAMEAQKAAESAAKAEPMIVNNILYAYPGQDVVSKPSMAIRGYLTKEAAEAAYKKALEAGTEEPKKVAPAKERARSDPIHLGKTELPFVLKLPKEDKRKIAGFEKIRVNLEGTNDWNMKYRYAFNEEWKGQPKESRAISLKVISAYDKKLMKLIKSLEKAL